MGGWENVEERDAGGDREAGTGGRLTVGRLAVERRNTGGGVGRLLVPLTAYSTVGGAGAADGLRKNGIA